MTKFADAKRMLDKKANYFWQVRDSGIYALVNAFTLKTAVGVRSRLDAIKMTNSLLSMGYHVAKLQDWGE